MNELLNINPTTLDGDSVYNFQLHLPIPTRSYIMRETGMDLILATGNEVEADALLRFMSITAMNMIKANVPSNARLNIEFLIAKNKRHREAFLEVVAMMILSAKGKGIDTLLEGGQATIDTLSRIARVQAEANDLLVHHYDFTIKDVRSDY